jgi:alpha-L-fucosidase
MIMTSLFPAMLLGNAANAKQTASVEPARSVDPHANETKAQRDARMHWWRQARFGMFIHWGLYAVPAGIWKGQKIGSIGEWIMNTAKIPVAEYAALAKQFDPTEFNADTWVSIAKSAGMKYIVMTAKHHDGFAMFHSLTDPYNIYDATPFKRDPIAEMAAACKKQDIKFGVYYSQAQDWHHPGGAAYGGHWDKAQDGDLDLYVKTIAAPQVRELLTRYHPAVLWWDTPVTMSKEDIELLTSAFSSDPGLIANNRLGNGVPGDTETPEQFIPATGFPGRDWETCMTINDTWGYKSYDTNFKSSDSLIRNLIDIASKGGNYLLNVGPDARGIIPAPEVQRLQDMGRWLKVNGESIYGTTASPYKRLPFDGRATVRGNTLYLNVFTWPESGLKLSGLQTPVRGAKALATGQKLTVQKEADGTLTISKPESLDMVSTVVVLNLSGPPVVKEPEISIEPGSDGSYKLTASDAVLEGDTIKTEGAGDNTNIGFWTNAADSAKWNISVPAAQTGAYHADILFSCEQGNEGSEFKLQIDGVDSGVTGKVTSTENWTTYQTMKLDGVLTLSSGKHILRILPLNKTGGGVMNLRSITLIPVSQ